VDKDQVTVIMDRKTYIDQIMVSLEDISTRNLKKILLNGSLIDSMNY